MKAYSMRHMAHAEHITRTEARHDANMALKAGDYSNPAHCMQRRAEECMLDHLADRMHRNVDNTRAARNMGSSMHGAFEEKLMEVSRDARPSLSSSPRGTTPHGNNAMLPARRFVINSSLDPADSSRFCVPRQIESAHRESLAAPGGRLPPPPGVNPFLDSPDILPATPPLLPSPPLLGRPGSPFGCSSPFSPYGRAGAHTMAAESFHRLYGDDHIVEASSIFTPPRNRTPLPHCASPLSSQAALTLIESDLQLLRNSPSPNRGALALPPSGSPTATLALPGPSASMLGTSIPLVIITIYGHMCYK